MAGGGSMVIICIKLVFPYNKNNIFYLTTKFVKNIENGNPISIPIKSYQPNKIN